MSAAMSTREAAPMRKLAIIGCGLMGGSLALALKRAEMVDEVVGYSRNPQTRALACELGVIDSAAPGLAQAVHGADMVVLATPVGALAATMANMAPYLSRDAVITDVGSTKSDVVAHAQAHLRDHVKRFVPSHPIAGKEHAGVAHADADLYENRKVILTPLPHNALGAIAKVQAMWRVCGADVIQMSPQEHDTVFAAVSHLPHLLAFAYINGLADQTRLDQYLALAGPGFRDFTRIAGANPDMWRDVYLSNREAIRGQLDHFKTALARFEQALDGQDAAGLMGFVARSRDIRAPWQLNAAIPRKDDLTQQ